MRTRHIHYQVTGRADRLVTQAYFPGEPLNATDFFLSHETRPQDLMLHMAAETPPALPAKRRSIWFWVSADKTVQ